MKKLLAAYALLAGTLSAQALNYSHIYTGENLDRGVVAVKTPSGVFVSWRSLSADDAAMTYDVYRGETKINDTPLKVTNFTDPAGTGGDTYTVKCLSATGVAGQQTVNAWDAPYLRVHLDRPEGGTSPAGGKDELREYTYTPDDVSVGDVDGDGQYELFVKWHPTNQADNSFRRFTGNTYIDCYKLDGTRLWRIDLGINIRSGNHYTQFMVWDFDGDGKAEMMCKTAPGTVDGIGRKVVMGTDNPDADYRNTGSNSGIILSGPEYLTVFNGCTGAEISTIAYNPPRNIISNWGDSYGNRCERYLACVAYLDGVHPSAVFCRGYYTAAYLWAVDFDGTVLTERWLHASTQAGKGAYGEGAHAISVGDVDGDGKDEIVYGAACIDDDGSLLYRTGAGHGDALHLAAMLPERGGLQVFMPHEEKSSSYKWDAELRDAATGEILYGNPQSGTDNGRGLAANVSAKWPGYEYWSSVTSCAQNHGMDAGSKKPDTNFRIYWDGDLLDELFDGRYNSSAGTAAPRVTKPNADITSVSTLATFTSICPYAYSCNTTKATPNLQADILGDWREEVILHDGSTESDLIIFTTTIPTNYRVTCLMQDRQYREAVAWQNVAYNQPPHLSYNLEEAFNTAGVIAVAIGNANQVVNLGEDLAPVTFNVKRATGVTLVHGPEWLNIRFDPETLSGTLSGTPDAEGEFSYRIETTGSAEGIEGALEGSIIVHKRAELTPMACFPFDIACSTTPNTAGGEAEARGGVVDQVQGVCGDAAALSGGAYYVQAPYRALDFGTADFTVELWVRSTASNGYILHKGSTTRNASTGATGNWVGLEIKNGVLKFAIDDDVVKSGIDVAGASKWMDNNWHHIVAVRDTYARLLTLYVDGEEVGSATDATGAVDCVDEALVIGNVNVTFNNAFTGELDQLTIYSGAMSASKVKERYNTVGIYDITADCCTETVYTLVDAFSGRIASKGSSLGIIDSAPAGVYILVIEDRNGYRTFKLRK